MSKPFTLYLSLSNQAVLREYCAFAGLEVDALISSLLVSELGNWNCAPLAEELLRLRAFTPPVKPIEATLYDHVTDLLGNASELVRCDTHVLASYLLESACESIQYAKFEAVREGAELAFEDLAHYALNTVRLSLKVNGSFRADPV